VAQAVPLAEAIPRYAAPVYALGLRVEADRAELARARHPGRPAPDDATATALLDRLERAVQGPAGAGLPELAAWHALAPAERTRQQGRPDPAAWAAAAAAWERLGQPYRAAYAGFRHAETLLATTGDRATAAQVLGAPPPSPAALAPAPSTARPRPWPGVPASTWPRPPAPRPRRPAPAAQLGLTRREVEVLALVAAGRSNRQIAQAVRQTHVAEHPPSLPVHLDTE
jgi:hypothetical protein